MPAADRRTVDGGDDRKAKSTEAQDQGIHEPAHLEMRPLPRLLGLQVNRMQVQSAAKHVVAAGDHHRARAAVALL